MDNIDTIYRINKQLKWSFAFTVFNLHNKKIKYVL